MLRPVGPAVLDNGERLVPMDEKGWFHPEGETLDEWLKHCGTRTGTVTINGHTYTDLNEVEWRQANNDWSTPRPDAASTEGLR